MNDRELTSGEKTVGLDFNIAGLKEVDNIRAKAADLLDELFAQQNEAVRLMNLKKIQFYDVAIEAVTTACMYGVKACTWKY